MVISITFSVFFFLPQEIENAKEYVGVASLPKKVAFQAVFRLFFLNKLIYCNYISAQSGWREGHRRSQVLFTVHFLDVEFFWKSCLDICAGPEGWHIRHFCGRD